MKQKGFFDEEDRLRELSRIGDPLEKINRSINWEIFRQIIIKALKRIAKRPDGRPPYDYSVMFKILILHKLYHISDAQAEYQIKERLSFMRFLGLTLSAGVPDDKTIWFFREQLVNAKIMESLFKRFLKELEKKNLITCEGGTKTRAAVCACRRPLA